MPSLWNKVRWGAALVGIIGGHAKKYSVKGRAAEKIQYKINFHDSPLTPPPPKGSGVLQSEGQGVSTQKSFSKIKLVVLILGNA